MKAEIRSYIEMHGMIVEGDHVICALSGGKDSVFLFKILLELRSELGFTLSAAHFNHMLRGAEAERDENFVKEICTLAEVPCFVGRENVQAYAEAYGLGIEEAARKLRYDYLLDIDQNAKIATAHTADDNLETVLMHLTRGCGLHGLTGIPPVRGRIIRPILNIGSEKIRAYLRQNKISFVEDSTNSHDDYTRNRVRHGVIPALKSENPRLTDTFSRMTETLIQEDQFLQECAKQALQEISDSDSGLNIAKLQNLHRALQHRVLRLYLKTVPSLTVDHVDAALALCKGNKPSGRLNLPGKQVLQRSYDRVFLTSFTGLHTLDTVPLQLDGTVQFGNMLIQCETVSAPQKSEGGQLYVMLKPEAKYIIRPRVPGDRIALPGGTKKLGRLMIDLKIPAYERDLLPVLINGTEVIALLPYTVATSHRAKHGESCYLITIRKSEE